MTTHANDLIWMPKRLRFTVTQEHIEQGTPGVCHACPVALALEERGWFARVDGYVVQLFGPEGKGYAEYRPSPRLTRFVFTFDGNLDPDAKVEPSTFVIERIDREEGYEQDYREWGP